MNKSDVVLLVEDETLVGEMVKEYLNDSGYLVAGPIDNSERALELLESVTPDFAILDLKLGDRFCVDVALELRERGVPFVVYSGYRKRDTDADWEVFVGVPWIAKPTPVEAVIEALRQVAPPIR